MKIGAGKTIFYGLQFSTLKRSYFIYCTFLSNYFVITPNFTKLFICSLIFLYIQLEVDVANLQVRSNIIKLKI